MRIILKYLNIIIAFIMDITKRQKIGTESLIGQPTIERHIYIIIRRLVNGCLTIMNNHLIIFNINMMVELLMLKKIRNIKKV